MKTLTALLAAAILTGCGGQSTDVPMAGDPCAVRGEYVQGTCMYCSCTMTGTCTWKQYTATSCASAEQACEETPSACTSR